MSIASVRILRVLSMLCLIAAIALLGMALWTDLWHTAYTHAVLLDIEEYVNQSPSDSTAVHTRDHIIQSIDSLRHDQPTGAPWLVGAVVALLAHALLMLLSALPQPLKPRDGATHDRCG